MVVTLSIITFLLNLTVYQIMCKLFDLIIRGALVEPKKYYSGIHKSSVLEIEKERFELKQKWNHKPDLKYQ